MLISADLIPLKKLVQDYPTARVIDLCQQLQLTPYVHLVNCRLSTAGTLNKQVAELAEIYLPLPQNLWNTLAAASESVPCSFNTALVDERTSLASGISEEAGIVHFEPILQIDPRSLAPLQLTKFSRAQLETALANVSKESEKLHKCMNAMVNKGWVEYLQPNEQVKLGRRWQWQVPNDYPKAAADLLFRNGLIDSKQDFLLICLSQQGKPLNPKSTSIADTSNAMEIVEKLLNPILSA